MPKNTKPKGPGGRPTLAEAERRCKQTNTRWTIAEYGHLHQQAAAAGLSVGEFIRRRALLLPVTPPPQRSDSRLLHELNAIGVNINQIARNLNSHRKGSPGVDWTTVQTELRRVLEKVGAVIQ
ncbi:plasmid mobilization relaxosome protein MobC [bacterium AH-315-J04]|nr:plasmid mobilization relaxosome protein MobC [bacterium AH-315-J04]